MQLAFVDDSSSCSLCFSLLLAADTLHFVANYEKAALEQGPHAGKQEMFVASSMTLRHMKLFISRQQQSGWSNLGKVRAVSRGLELVRNR